MHRIAYFKTPPQTGELVYPSPPGAVGIAEKSQGVVGAHCKGGNTSLELQRLVFIFGGMSRALFKQTYGTLSLHVLHERRLRNECHKTRTCFCFAQIKPFSYHAVCRH